MQVGSLVETVSNFKEIRDVWDVPYPNKGDILIISAITQHHNKKIRKKGIVLLQFEELPNNHGICDKKVNGKPNFIELLPPIDLQTMMSRNLKNQLYYKKHEI
jgi:hypothetical protein